MAGELFKAMAGVDILHVPYKGSAGARTDILGGQVRDDVRRRDGDDRSTSAQARSRRSRTSGTSRSAVLPDVPTIAEAGVPGYEATIWLGLMAPKNTPPRSSTAQRRDRQDRRRNREVRDDVGRSKARPPMTMSPAEFAQATSNDDIVKWAQIVKISGAKPDQ